MLIIISPAKTLDYSSSFTLAQHTIPDLLDESEQLVARLRELTPPEIESLMQISNQLANLNFGRYLNWRRPFTVDNARQCLLAFKGAVYTGLEAESFSEQDFDFAQQHLRILSGLYGVLRPLDLIQPYRLEMSTKLTNNEGKDLYAFWGDKITAALNAQLQNLNSQTLVNLASAEYYRAVKPAKLHADVITPEFREWKNNQYRIITVFTKKARGSMSAWLIKNRIDSVSDIPNFDLDGYQYHPALSEPDKPVFTRNHF